MDNAFFTVDHDLLSSQETKPPGNYEKLSIISLILIVFNQGAPAVHQTENLKLVLFHHFHHHFGTNLINYDF